MCMEYKNMGSTKIKRFVIKNGLYPQWKGQYNKTTYYSTLVYFIE